MKTIIDIKKLKKVYNSFSLDIPALNIPEGFVTALIGENGAGKTTLLKILAGIESGHTGNITYFDNENDIKKIKENLGYTGSKSYFLPTWSIDTIKATSSFLYNTFSPEKFIENCRNLDLWDYNVPVSSMSDGMKMKTEIAAILARNTQMLIMDEPASPLDPLMRQELCSLISNYVNEQKSVLFSTHNISDMESITDYAIIMAQGKVVEEGFVEELKEKYLMVKGEAEDTKELSDILMGCAGTEYGCEGICQVSNLDKLAGFNVTVTVPNLTQISVAIMKKYSILNN